MIPKIKNTKTALAAVLSAALMSSFFCACSDDKNNGDNQSRIPETDVSLSESYTESSETVSDISIRENGKPSAVSDGSIDSFPDITDSNTEYDSHVPESSIRVPTEYSEEYIELPDSDGGLIPIQTSDNEKPADMELEMKIIQAYTANDIKTGEEHQKPSDGKVFLIAEIELNNPTNNNLPFLTIYNIIPSVDDNVISLGNYINAFPVMLNGYENLINKGELTVFRNSTLKGYIAVEAPSEFSCCEFTHCNDIGVVNSYRYSLKDNITVNKQEPLKNAKSEGIEVSLLQCERTDGSEYELSAAKEGFCYITLTVEIKNISKVLTEVSTDNYTVKYKDSSYSTLFPSVVGTIIPPEKHIERKFVMEVPESADTLSFIQTKTNETELFEFNIES